MDVATPLLRFLASFALLFAVILLAIDRLIVRQVRKAGATSSDRATEVSVGPLGRLRLKRLVGGGALKSVAPGRYYLDEAGFAAYRTVRRRRALTIVGVLLAGIAVAWAFGIVTF